MKLKRILIAVFVLTACFGGGNLSPTGDITSVTPTTGGGLEGGATVGAAQLGLLTSCGSTQVLKWSGSAWACAADTDTNTTYTAGTGLSLGGTTFSANLVGATCATNTVMTALGATGTGTCAAPPSFTSGLGGYAPASGGGTVNYLRADGAWAAPASITYTAGTNLALASTTFSVTPTVSLAGASNTATMAATNSAAGQTSNVNVVQGGNSSATFNTTAGAKVSTAVSGSSTSTRSAGANTLTNIGVYGTATGAQTNYSGYFDVGSFYVNGTSTFGSTMSVGGNGQFDLALNSTGNLTENSSRVITLGGTGLSKSGGMLTLNMTAQTCSANQHISAATSVGVFTCSADAATPTPITATITSNQNDWSPAGFGATTTLINLTTVSGTPSISGISATGRATGSRVTLTNNGSTFFTILNESGSSAAANRIRTQTAFTRMIGDYGSVTLIYTGSYWTEETESTRYRPELYSTGALIVSGTSALTGTVSAYGDTYFGDAAADNSYHTGNVYSVGQTPGLGKPTLSTCGTSPALYGGSSGFNVTPGSGAPTACTVTFATAYLDVPSCVITRIGGTSQQWFQWSSLSASAGTFQACNSTACGGNTLTDSYSIQCVGASINAANP